MITGISEPKILTKHISCKCICKFDGRKCNSNQKQNNDKCRYNCKNPKEYNRSKKNYIWNATLCSFENAEYSASTIDDLVITCDEILDGSTKVMYEYCVIKSS